LQINKIISIFCFVIMCVFENHPLQTATGETGGHYR